MLPPPRLAKSLLRRLAAREERVALGECGTEITQLCEEIDYRPCKLIVAVLHDSLSVRRDVRLDRCNALLPCEVYRLAAVRCSGMLPTEAAAVSGRGKGRGVVEGNPLERANVIALAFKRALCGGKAGRRSERGGGGRAEGKRGKKGREWKVLVSG